MGTISPGSNGEYGGEGQQVFARIPSSDLERGGIKRWDFGDLPETLDLDRGGIRLRGYPALVDAGDSVAIRVLDSQEGAGACHARRAAPAADAAAWDRTCATCARTCRAEPHAAAVRQGAEAGRKRRFNAGGPGGRAGRDDPGFHLRRGAGADPGPADLRGAPFGGTAAADVGSRWRSAPWPRRYSGATRPSASGSRISRRSTG